MGKFKMPQLLLRTASGFVLTLITVGLLIPGRYFLLGGLFILSIVGMYEFYSCVEHGGHKPWKTIGLIFCVLYYGLVILMYWGSAKLGNTDHMDFTLVFLTIFMSVLMVACVKDYPEHRIEDAALTLAGLVYVPVMFSMIYMLRSQRDGIFLVWYIFFSAWGCDIFAYLTGSLFGKHPFVPKLSPKKTLEGVIGGAVASVAICVIYGLIIKDYVELSNFRVMLMSVLSGVAGAAFGIIGDLFASSVKRFMHIKDYGNLIPGHGGILDRYDSILLVAPIVFLIFKLVLVI